MKRSIATVLGSAVAISLALAGCSSNGGEEGPTPEPFPSGPVSISLSAWSLSSTPEFKTLADGFNKLHPNVTVELKEYDPAEYDTLITADLAAQNAPDIITQKNFKQFYTYVDGGALLPVDDVVAKLPATTSGAAAYTIDGSAYGVPYRQDSWVLYYNKDLFAKAGVDLPDGTWTWADYVTAAKDLTDGLKKADPATTAKGTYQHSWQSTVQGLALAQTAGADLESGDYGYLKPAYERALDLQDAGAQETLGTVTTNKLRYQDAFGKQNAAMMVMGTWYVATYLSDQKAGKADAFEWGIAPAPQSDSSAVLPSGTPVTFGDPTGLAINAGVSGEKLTVAKAFLEWAAGPDASVLLAGIGITPANTDDSVVAKYFSVDGEMPTENTCD